MFSVGLPAAPELAGLAAALPEAAGLALAAPDAAGLALAGVEAAGLALADAAALAGLAAAELAGGFDGADGAAALPQAARSSVMLPRTIDRTREWVVLTVCIIRGMLTQHRL